MGTVVVYVPEGNAQRDHSSASQRWIAGRLASIKGYQFAGEYDPAARYSRPVYFVPSEVLAESAARALGIHNEQDLFGGVVQHYFVATKAITHGVVDGEASAPDGWCPEFSQRVREVVLKGYTAFTLQDARRAAALLLEFGPVRVKAPQGRGGIGQRVLSGQSDLEDFLQGAGPEELSRHGLTLEQNLERAVTFSVGRIVVEDICASYCGRQRLTRNNRAEDIYGGSDLVFARGDFDCLLALGLPADARLAIAQARTYDEAVARSFPGFFASRRNYDVVKGFDSRQRSCSGVLEQSWRLGGASSAEALALQAFRAQPELRSVDASCTELYGAHDVPPADALIYFDGVDPHAGPMTKYAQVRSHDFG